MITFQQFKNEASKLKKTTIVLPDEFRTLDYEDFQSDYHSIDRGFRLFRLKHGAASIPWFYNSSFLKHYKTNSCLHHTNFLVHNFEYTRQLHNRLKRLLDGTCRDNYKRHYIKVFSKEVYNLDQFTISSQADYFFLSDSKECDVYVVYTEKNDFCIIPAVIDDGMLCSSLDKISNSKDSLQTVYESLSRKIQFFEHLGVALAEQSKLKQLLNG